MVKLKNEQITLKEAKRLSVELYNQGTNSTKYPKPGNERELKTVVDWPHKYKICLQNNAGKLEVRVYWSLA